MSTQTLACNNNWLDSSIGNYVPTETTAILEPAFYVNLYPWYYPVYQTSPARPIKLTLSEVERLRKAARSDDKLKVILSKFTNQIEITVDFD